MTERPNLLVVLADQWRGQDQGWTGESAVRTPHLDRLATTGVAVRRAFANFPVCGPSRGSLLTGQPPARHGVVANDLPIRDDVPTFAEVLGADGYRTGWVGNWHLNGMPRLQWVPPERRGGFTRWASAHCSHRHRDGHYFIGDTTAERIDFTGYEPEVLTDLAIRWIEQDHAAGRRFAHVVSLAPPHDPYDTVPQHYRDRHPADAVRVRGNAEDDPGQRRMQQLYWAAISAVDDQLGRLLATLERLGELENTLVVVTADHGDMLGSHGLRAKQVPYAESVRVPMVLSWPDGLPAGSRPNGGMGVVDLAPTVLGLLGRPGALGPTLGRDLSAALRGTAALRDEVLCSNDVTFDNAVRQGTPVWRGFIDATTTYARSADGPWLLFDDRVDPWQQHNLVVDPDRADDVVAADRRLDVLLAEAGAPTEQGLDLVSALGLQAEWNARERGLHGPEARLLGEPG